MAPVQLIEEKAKLFFKTLQATRSGKLSWEETASSQTLVAVLNEKLELRLDKVPDHASGEPDAAPDVVLGLVRETQEVFATSNRDFVGDARLTFEMLSDDNRRTPFSFFMELWQLAFMNACGVEEELKRASDLLDRL